MASYYGMGPYGKGPYSRAGGVVWQVGGATQIAFNNVISPIRQIQHAGADTQIAFGNIVYANVIVDIAEAISSIGFDVQGNVEVEWQAYEPCVQGTWTVLKAAA